MSPTDSASKLLTSWKEIANYLGKGVRTVQRWEATLGLPIIRPASGQSGIVMARTNDLEAWILQGAQRAHAATNGRPQANNPARATFEECMRELHRYQAEVRALCHQVDAAHQILQREIERLRFLYAQWDGIRGRALGEANVAIASKVN